MTSKYKNITLQHILPKSGYCWQDVAENWFCISLVRWTGSCHSASSTYSICSC